MKALNLFNPKLIVIVFLAINLIKVFYSVVVVEEDMMSIIVRVSLFGLFILLTSLFLNRKILPTFILLAIIFLTGIGFILPGIGIFIYHDKLIQRILLTALGLYLLFGSVINIVSVKKMFKNGDRGGSPGDRSGSTAKTQEQ